jgi:hypothetical protein
VAGLRVTKFLREVNERIPDQPHQSTFQTPELISRLWNDSGEPDEVYFIGWVAHTDGRHVTGANLSKTGRLLGPDARRSCAKNNVSSRWSADPREKRR